MNRLIGLWLLTACGAAPVAQPEFVPMGLVLGTGASGLRNDTSDLIQAQADIYGTPDWPAQITQMTIEVVRSAEHFACGDVAEAVGCTTEYGTKRMVIRLMLRENCASVLGTAFGHELTHVWSLLYLHDPDNGHTNHDLWQREQTARAVLTQPRL